MQRKIRLHTIPEDDEWYCPECKICVEEGEEAVAGCDGLCYYCKYDAYDGDDYKIKFDQIRPRARKLLLVSGKGGKSQTAASRDTVCWRRSNPS